MSQEPDRKQQILGAAFEEFAERGFHGATIKSIAERAGVQSPALIYWYFPEGKEQLFFEAAESKISFLKVLEDPEPLLDSPPEEFFPMVARAYLEFASKPDAKQILRLVLAEAPRRPELLDAVVARGPLKVLGFLSAYLQRQIELGRLRPHDTRASARAFIGMLMPQAISHIVLNQLRENAPTDEEHMNTTIDIFLRGLRPDQPETNDGSN